MKRIVYLGLTIFLGILVGANLSFWTEKWLIDQALASGQALENNFFVSFESYLSPYFWLLMIIGAAAGWFVGRHWWRVAYLKARR